MRFFTLFIIYFSFVFQSTAESKLEIIIDYNVATKNEAVIRLGAGQESINMRQLPTSVPEVAKLAQSTPSRDTLSEFERLLNLPPAIVPYEDGLESIFFPDRRVIEMETGKFPQSAVALLATENLGRCTAWLVSPDTAITAGHCVHEGGEGGVWAANVKFFPGKNGSISPFDSCSAISLHSVSGWVVHRDKNYDYGAIKLDCEIGTNTGYFGVADPKRFENYLNSSSQISGYPVDKPATQWTSVDKITDIDELKLFHQNDTKGGMSGSPVHNGDNEVFAIHTNAKHNGGKWRSNNAATLINEVRFKNIVYWIDQ